MKRTVKWGIIGLGGIAQDFASHFPTEQAEMVGAASRNLQKATDFAEQFHIPKAYGNYHLLARDPEIEAVYIATPNHRHAKDILMCLKNGKHVFCEKSITMTSAELEEAMSLATENKLWLAEAMTIYHMPLYTAVKKRIASGELGNVRMISAFFGAPKEWDPDNRFFSQALGGGALFDIGVYALAFVRQFLDDSPVTLRSSVQLTRTGVDEESALLLQTESGQQASVSLSFRSAMPRTGWVICEKAYITIPDYSRADTASITFEDGRTELLQTGQKEKALLYEIEQFTHTILTGVDHTFLSYTKSVTDWMDQAATEWDMNFD